MKETRVVITGMGAVSPLGNSVEELWNQAISGVSGANPISRFNPVHHKTKFACEVKNFNPEKHLDNAEVRRSDLYTQFSLYAATEAVKDSGLNLTNISPYDIGVIWGSGQGGVQTFEKEISDFAKGDGVPRFSPFFIPKIILNIAPGMIAIKHGFMGVNLATVSACSSSNHAMIDAYLYIKAGKAKAFVTGGAEAAITESICAGFGSMKALSTDNEEYTRAARPFDVTRNGFVMGEGGAAFILEEYEHAKKRGAEIYAEIIGVGATADAYHLSSSHPEGRGAARSMSMAMKEAGLNEDQVDYLNAHATSTQVGDLSEAKAIYEIFGDKGTNLVIGATKSMTGHLLGGAGALEGVLSVLAIKNNQIPPTINTSNIDPQIPNGLKFVGNEAMSKKVDVAMSNTFGFGGHNSTVIFRAV